MCKDDSMEEMHQPLFDWESSNIYRGIATVTFFDGDINSIFPHFQKRLQQILGKNPWLSGKLVKVENTKKKDLVYSKSTTVDAILQVLTEPVPKLNMVTEYEEMRKACMSVAEKHCGKSGHICQFVLSPLATTESSSPGFALVYYLSHAVSDGYTYYEVLNMLSDSADSSVVRALSPVRKMEYEKVHMPKTRGGEGFMKLTKSLTYKKALISGILSGSAARPLAYYVDEEKVAALKKDATLTKDVPFVSTNDILVSHFANACKPSIMTMAFNSRGRISILDSNDAGNYQGSVPFDNGTYETPAGIRKSLAPKENGDYSGLTSPLPSFWEKCTLALTSSWTIKGSVSPFDLKSNGIKQRLHLPIVMAPMPISRIFQDVALVFRPVPDKIAVFYVAKEASPDKLLMDGSPLGESVNKALFPDIDSANCQHPPTSHLYRTAICLAIFAIVLYFLLN